MIDGVVITPLQQILDERGKIMHMMHSDSPGFVGFGEIYFSCIYPGVVKAWHIHREMTLNYAVPVGRIKLVLFDDREGSQTNGQLQVIFLGLDNYCRVTVPPMVWNGFKGIGLEMAVVANCASISHDPNEIERRDPSDPSIPYDWALRHG
jgi:dTDP-4-dehydrorhamnose 3,5-epimerase